MQRTDSLSAIAFRWFSVSISLFLASTCNTRNSIHGEQAVSVMRMEMHRYHQP